MLTGIAPDEVENGEAKGRVREKEGLLQKGEVVRPEWPCARGFGRRRH